MTVVAHVTVLWLLASLVAAFGWAWLVRGFGGGE